MNKNKLTNIQLGRLGESIALQYLERNEFRVLDKNFRTKWGEIDVIAMSNMSLRFIEVKTKGLSANPEIDYFELIKADSEHDALCKNRKGNLWGRGGNGSVFDNPLHRVNMLKVQRMKKVAYIYLSRNMPHILGNDFIEISFDVLSIVVNVPLNRAQIVWYKNYLN